MPTSESTQSVNTVTGTTRRGVLRPPSISSFATSYDNRSRAGSNAGSLRREQDPEPQPPPPRLPRQPRPNAQSYASDASGTRSRPVTPPAVVVDNYPPARPRRQAPQSNNGSPPPTPRRAVSRTTLGQDSERASQAQSERERMSQAQSERERLSQVERERSSQIDTRPIQPTIVIPSAVRDAAPSPRIRTPAQDSISSPRVRTPAQSSPVLSPSQSVSRAVSKNTIRPPSPPPITPSSPSLRPPQRDPHARISYFDPTNQAVSERLLEQNVAVDAGESALGNVEDMLEGFEWQLRSGSGAADQIEARLKDELLALEKVCLQGA